MSLMPTGTPCSGPIGCRSAALVERARLRHGMFGIEMDEGVHVAFERRDAFETGADIVLGRNRAARHLGGRLGRRQRC